MRRAQRQGSIYVFIASTLLVACASRQSSPVPDIPPHSVVGVQENQLQPEFWIARESNSKRTVLDSRAIAEQNARLLQLDPSVHDLEKFPQALAAPEVRSWIGKLSEYPDEDLFDNQGRKLEKPDLDALIESTALESVPASQPTRYGLVVRRADLRTFPSTLRAYDSADDRDIDRFQESALFPGTRW
jgi:hypothetical protein